MKNQSLRKKKEKKKKKKEKEKEKNKQKNILSAAKFFTQHAKC